MKIKNLLVFVLVLITLMLFTGCKKSTLVSIEIDASNATVEFAPGDDYSYSGLKVIGKYDDGSTKEVSGFNVDSSSYQKDVIGEYEITVTYTEGEVECSAKYSVEVSAGTLKSITLDTTNVKTIFYIGEEFNYDGLVVTAVYNDYSVIVNDYSISCKGFDSSVEGSYSVTVEYKVGSVTRREYYAVEVVDKLNSVNRLVGLDVYFSDGTNKQEAVFKTVSVLDEVKYDFSDLVVEASYIDGSKVQLDSSKYSIKTDHVNLNKRGSYEVVITYSETYDFSSIGQENITLTEDNFFLLLVENKATNIEFVSGKTNFTAEEEPTSEDWVFEVTLENGDKEVLSSEDMKIEAFPFISGDHSIGVTYTQEQLTEGEANIVLNIDVLINIAEPSDEGGIKTYQFAASSIDATGLDDKSSVAAGTAYAKGYFTVTGTVLRKITDGKMVAYEVGKGASGGLQFTVNGTAEVTLAMGSTGSSNTSAVGIVDLNNNLIPNKEGITTVTGTAEVIMTYTLTSGIYKITSPVDSENARNARLYSVVVVETPNEGGETITTYLFDTATIEVAPGQEDRTPIAEGTEFLDGYFKTFGAVVQRLNSSLTTTSYVEVGADESSGITFTITGTAEIVINVSSTGGTNASSVGIIDAEGNAIVNEQGITVVEGTGVVALSYKLEAGTYSVVSLNDTDETRDRGARVYTISVIETKKGE